MLEEIKFESKITLNDVPVQWISEFELYYPDLPKFPIVYVHIVKDCRRIYGFPVAVDFKFREGHKCDAEILFLSNADLDSNADQKNAVKSELGERFGLSNKVGLDDLISSCRGNREYEVFFKELWSHVSKASGEYVPYGRFFEEMYSIVRFVSAWQPKTGRQSEMRMLYNFLSIFGEKIEIKGKWGFLHFFLIPTYDDMVNEQFGDFPKFGALFRTMEKIWAEYFTETSVLDGVEIKSMERAWPQDKDSFIEEVSDPLLDEGKITADEKLYLERLVDAFNRNGWRTAFFVWAAMAACSKDYRTWDRDFFVKFYNSKTGVGIAEKTIACFLQQGFGKEEFIPIDTWVRSFYELALGIPTQEEFFDSFSKMGKMERIIWFVSRAKKTNIKTFFDMLWCTRYGVTGNKELRGPNPISCYECKLRKCCPSYNKIKDEKVLVIDEKHVTFENLMTRKGNVKGKIISAEEVTSKADRGGCSFICITKDGVPKKVCAKRGKYWRLIDEFSGFLLKSQKTDKVNRITEVVELVGSLPRFSSDIDSDLTDDL